MCPPRETPSHPREPGSGAPRRREAPSGAEHGFAEASPAVVPGVLSMVRSKAASFRNRRIRAAPRLKTWNTIPQEQHGLCVAWEQSTGRRQRRHNQAEQRFLDPCVVQ
jgi:hypothetical protein